MKNLLENIEEILLMRPGSSYVVPEVYSILRKKILDHLDSHFLAIV
ncbi:MAG: hypothetical protein LBQ00_00975 [Syntrophobacterales bacterium]|jgi:aspartate aminotransferase-like enzyme|nr:hypothetical protein [Syntrophobacterales bacterium]